MWDFGDGTGEYGADAQIEHAFRRTGDLTVTLTVVDARGGATTTTSAVSVSSAKEDDGLLGCGCTLAGSGPTPRTGLLGGMMLLVLALVRRRIQAAPIS